MDESKREWEDMTVGDALKLADNRLIWWRPDGVLTLDPKKDPAQDLVQVVR